MVITRTEIRALSILTLLLLLGAGVRQWRLANPIYDAEYYAEVQASFQAHVDSLRAIGVLAPDGSDTLTPILSAEPTFPVDINSAAAITLEALPGIGPGLAARIVDYRERNGPFKDVDQLLEVRGIGEQKLAGLRDFATANLP